MKRKVVYARLHQNAYIQGVGELGNVFPSNVKRLNELEMHSDTGGLFVKFNWEGKTHEALIPSANVVIMSLEPETYSESNISKIKSIKSV